LNIVPYWLHTCLTKHEECFSEPPEWLPARLVDVGGTHDDATARLVLTEGLQPRKCLYLTISHGDLSDTSASLTTANMQGYQDQIVLCELPRLFQLVIRAAKMLKHRYLWIEKLCVLQDSKGDMATEHLDKGRITIVAMSMRYMCEILEGSPVTYLRLSWSTIEPLAAHPRHTQQFRLTSGRKNC
jgi:hypothetical protein